MCVPGERDHGVPVRYLSEMSAEVFGSSMQYAQRLHSLSSHLVCLESLEMSVFIIHIQDYENP